MSTNLKLQPSLAEPSIEAMEPELLHDFLSTMAESNPAGTALEDGNTTMSFYELDRKAGRIANFLIGYDIESGDVVAIHQERSADLFASLFGVLKAGAAYVIVNPAATPESAADIIARSGAKLVLGSKRLPALSDLVDVRIVPIEDQRQTFEILSGQVSFGGARPTPEQASRVLCAASGEGAVSVTHKDAVSHVRSLTKFYGLGADRRCYHHASIAFDVAVEESLAMLAAGATVVLGRPANGSVEALAELVDERRITLLSTTPEIISGVEHDLPTLEVLVLSRNPSPTELVAEWSFRVRCVVSVKHPGDRLANVRIEDEGAAAKKKSLIAAPASSRKLPRWDGRRSAASHKLAA